MSEQMMMRNPALVGPRADDGGVHVFLVTDEDGAEIEVCFDCALTAFASGLRVECAGVYDGDDPSQPTCCEWCGRVLVPQALLADEREAATRFQRVRNARDLRVRNEPCAEYDAFVAGAAAPVARCW